MPLLHAVESTVPIPCHLAMVWLFFAVALSLAMVICQSFGPCELDAARGLVGNLGSAGNQVDEALPGETKRILPVLDLRAKTATQSTRKRTFLRARRRAETHGRALYRGRWYTAKQLGSSFQPANVPEGPGVLEAPQGTPLIRGKVGQPGRAGRLKIFSWNSGSGNSGLFDEIEAFGLDQGIDIICIQETRMSVESEWSSKAYHYIHSGKARSSTDASGILVMISTRLARPSHIRCSSIVKGHLLHVRVQVHDHSIDVLGLYQHSWKPSEGRQTAREQVLASLQRALSDVPRRNLLIVCGDFNTDFLPKAPAIGHAPVHKAPSSLEDTQLFWDLLTSNDLCAINTWGGKNEYTCTTMQGSRSLGHSFLDGILLRRMHADPKSRQSHADHLCPLGAGISGASYHAPIRASISRWWRCWTKHCHFGLQDHRCG